MAVALSPELLFQIAGLLVETGYLNITTHPLELIQTFQCYSENYITIISQQISQSPENVELFFNQTVPCMKSITLEAERKRKLNDTRVVLESFWDRW